MPNEKLEATIDLTINSKDFTKKNVIHQKEFKKVETLIKDQIPKSLDEITEGNDFEGYYKSILIEGARGTGKTTFLKNFAKANIVNNSFHDIEILSFLDPTRIEEKSSIFLTIISLIKKVVCDKFYSEKNNYGIECKRKSWNDNLSQLSKGLPSIDDSPKEPHYWDDDFMIMEKGLSATNASFNLRNNFKKLVKESLQILGKKAFLLIVDDVDTDCKKAWNLLETLRKYLCIQGFITIVSGNLELFSLEVRQAQSKRFGEPSSNIKENQILELTDQYIRKVFPPVSRVSLGKLTYVADKKVADDKIIISVKYDTTANEMPLIDYINAVLKKIGIKNEYQATAYTDFILSLPLRSQIDFYRVFKIFVIENSDNVTLSFDEMASLFIEDLIQHNHR